MQLIAPVTDPAKRALRDRYFKKKPTLFFHYLDLESEDIDLTTTRHFERDFTFFSKSSRSMILRHSKRVAILQE